MPNVNFHGPNAFPPPPIPTLMTGAPTFRTGPHPYPHLVGYSSTSTHCVDCPTICFIMLTMKSRSVLSGLRSSRASVAWSVASASAAKVSIMKFIQRSCTALRVDSSDVAARAVTNVMTMAVMLLLIWNLRNFRTVSFTQRSHIIV
jgi:hypothetical protein